MKLLVVTLLLLSAVPAGCLPVMAVGTIVDEVDAKTHRRSWRSSQKTGEAVILFAVYAVLAVAANLLFRSMLRKTHGEERVWHMGLGNDAWRFTLWGAYSAGVAFGVVMTLQLLDIIK